MPILGVLQVSQYFFGVPEFRSLPNDNKISDNKIRKNSEIYCHGISHEKQRFLTIVRNFFPSPTPLQNANFINIVVSASLRISACKFFCSAFFVEIPGPAVSGL